MNIPDTSTESGQREASVMLARLCGWITEDGAFYHYSPPGNKGASVNYKKGYADTDIFRPVPNGAGCLTLYDTNNMALAWHVLTWSMQMTKRVSRITGCIEYKYSIGSDVYDLMTGEDPELGKDIFEMLPAEAQRTWLDKILRLAVRARMIKAQQ